MSWMDKFIKGYGLEKDNSLFDDEIEKIMNSTIGNSMTSAVSPYITSSYGPSAIGTFAPGISSSNTYTTIYPSTPSIPPTNIFQLSCKGKEIVRLNFDGTVTWADDINIDEAAESFSKSVSVGLEISSGITKKVKLEMRDSIFNDLIAIAKDKGSLTADDLTYLLEASKIVEKLKGGKE